MPRTGWIHPGGHALRWAAWDAAPSQLPPFLLLHEALGCLELWRTFPERLQTATGRAVFAYERRGHGASAPLEASWSEGWLEREALDVLPAVLDALGLEAPILVGHSDGGTLALQFAAHHPDRVRGVVTLAAHVQVDERTRAGVAEAGRAYREGGLAEKLTRYHGPNTERLFRRWHDTWLSPAWQSWSMGAELDRITCPVLALQGELDSYGLEAQVHSIATGTGGRAEVIPGSGHAPHLDATERVLQAILAWLPSDSGMNTV